MMADDNDSEDEPLVARLPPSKRAKPDPGSHGKSPESQEVTAKVSSKVPPADSDSEDEPLCWIAIVYGRYSHPMVL